MLKKIPMNHFKRFIICTLFFTSFNHSKAQIFFKTHPGINPYQFETIKEKLFTHAAVTSAHPLASMVGAAIMQDGGNAFDAAIAVHFALAVVHPSAGNIGGGGFLLARTNNGKLIGLDFREAAPAIASRDMYLDEKGNPITSKSLEGPLASGIPGSVSGMFNAHVYAKLPMAQLMEPAIELAQYGFVLTEKEAGSLNSVRDELLKLSSAPSAYTKNTKWKKGDTIFQPELAATLRRIQINGLAGFYEGVTADLIVKEMANGSGIISTTDLKDYQTKKRVPIEFDYKNHHVISFSPPSSGGILIAQMMKMISPFDIAAMGYQSPAAVGLMVESQRRAYADRAEHMGDPDFWKVPTRTLISDAYAQQRMQDYTPGVAGNSKNTNAGHAKESEQTTHYSVIDKEGNMVAITTTLNGSYGNKTVVAGAGFLLNNEMDDFSTKPGVPNMFGALGGEANAIAPGKRMLSSMTPTLVTVNNKAYLTIGSPGGTTIPNQIYEGLINMIDFKMSLKQSIDASRFHHQWIPDQIQVEADFPDATIQALKKQGYKVNQRGYFGRMDGIRILPNGKIEAAGDKRGDDSVAGY
ncbi:MAG: gamma-glutamyltransferase [Chitinophagaceae bacterium]|nr:gamma-glutamyltransferase [Chitinophagaceae bacterium]